MLVVVVCVKEIKKKCVAVAKVYKKHIAREGERGCKLGVGYFRI